jgi:GTPase SAR1 family protein
MNPKGNEFQITMLGASGVGKTTLLLAMYEKLADIAKDIDFKLIPDEETKKILDKYLEQLKSLQNQIRADERDKGLQGTKAETLNPVIKLYIDKHNTPITSNFKLNRQSSGTSVHS